MLTAEQKTRVCQNSALDFVEWSFRALLVVFSISLVSACSVLGEDNRQAIAMATIYGNASEKRWVPVEVDPVINSALNTKFPAGTDIQQLNSFVSKLGGSCIAPAKSDQSQSEVACSLIESNTICISHTLVISASIDSRQTIRSLEVRRYNRNC